jgi:hypothetical protein
MHNNQGAGAVEKQATFTVTAPLEEEQRIIGSRIETNGNGDRITT